MSRYSVSTAYQLAVLAEAAYLDEADLEAALSSYSDIRFIENKETDTQCFTTEDDKNIYLSFRGTEIDKIRDAMTDVNILRRKLGNGSGVHSGFFRAATSIFDEVAGEIDRRDRNKNLCVTGHSLGADIAILVSYFLAVNGMRVSMVYPIAPARPGDESFREEYDDLLYDVTFCHMRHRDIVPRVPPRVLGNSHVGQTIYIDSDNKIRQGLAWWKMELDRVLCGRIEAIREAGIDDFVDHKISGYVEALANAARS